SPDRPSVQRHAEFATYLVCWEDAMYLDVRIMRGRATGGGSAMTFARPGRRIWWAVAVVSGGRLLTRRCRWPPVGSVNGCRSGREWGVTNQLGSSDPRGRPGQIVRGRARAARYRPVGAARDGAGCARAERGGQDHRGAYPDDPAAAGWGTGLGRGPRR